MSCTCPDQAPASCPECREYAEEKRRNRLHLRLERCGIPKDLRGITDLPPSLPAVARDAAQAWVRGDLSGLCLYGPNGTGKTTLAAAAAWKRLQGAPVCWVSIASLMTGLRSGHGSKAKAAADQIILGRGAIVLDDLDKANDSDFAREVLHALVDNRYAEGSPILVTTNRTLRELDKRVGSSVASRLAGYCEVVRIGGKDWRFG